MTITGTIENIEYREKDGHEKKVVTLKVSNRETGFIEFRGACLDLLVRVKEKDLIAVDIELKGSISKKTGIEYNNLVAYGLRRISV